MNDRVRKPIEEMTRDELTEFAGAITAQLRTAKLNIDTARRKANATGEYLTVEAMAELERRRAQLANLLGKINTQLGRLRRQRQATTGFESRFVEAARELMDPEFFELVKDRASEMEGER